MKKKIAMLLALTLSISMVNTAAAEVKIPAAYIALGDSLAAGQTPENQIDFGYADLIAQELGRNQPLALYSKELAFPGVTTSDVLERLKQEEAQEVITAANIITLSAGANDLLRLVQANPADGSLQFQRLQADFALNKARENIRQILTQLNDAAPNADIYVMGYYFAYPHSRESQKAGLADQVALLNQILKNEAEKAGAIFVSVDEAFGKDAIAKVPNPDDVHPNIKGYQAMANEFFEQYRSGWKIEDWELPEPAPVSFEEILQEQEQQEEQEEQKAKDVNVPSADEETAESVVLNTEAKEEQQPVKLFPDFQTAYLMIRTVLSIL